MKLAALAQKLNIPVHNKTFSWKKEYDSIRNYFFNKYRRKAYGNFQSPSVNPTTYKQRSRFQNEKEYSVYQRADFSPIFSEGKFNSYFPNVPSYKPQTAFFNSGMASIATLIFYFKNVLKLKKMMVGENVYFETKWIFDNYDLINYFNEYQPKIPNDFNVIWLEYPINCIRPEAYSFNSFINLESIMENVIEVCNKSKSKRKYIVIDYTLFYIPFDIKKFLKKIPDNLSVYLVTSLQKHRGYGLDLINAGAITYYNCPLNQYEEFCKLRAILGTNVTQEALWLMPEINPRIVNKLIYDSGQNAKKIYKKLCENQNPYVKVYFSNNNIFLNSFIFLGIDRGLIKRWKSKKFLSDLLIECIVDKAKQHHVILANGMSFGLPYTRIFKNSERYQNADSLRIAIGYDAKMNKHIPEAIVGGINAFISKYCYDE